MTPLAATTWVDDALQGRSTVAGDFNWDALAAGCATLAIDQDDPSWAALGAELYEHLARDSASAEDEERRTFSAMQLHAQLARSPLTVDRAERAARVLNWFRQTLPTSFPEAKNRASDWQALPAHQIRGSGRSRTG